QGRGWRLQGAVTGGGRGRGRRGAGNECGRGRAEAALPGVQPAARQGIAIERRLRGGEARLRRRGRRQGGRNREEGDGAAKGHFAPGHSPDTANSTRVRPPSLAETGACATS